jgi:hypothetical protein
MKKQLLVGSALLAMISANSQNGQNILRSKMTDMAKEYAKKYELMRRAGESTASHAAMPAGPQNQNTSGAAKTAATTWNALTGSMNIYGVLEGDAKPLQYNEDLNAVSFIHRKSSTYVSSPVATPAAAASGVIVAEISTNLGQTWDSTCLWISNTNYARYPQGGLYNPPGNTNIANAYALATGPITNGTNWTGSYLTSKKLDVFNNIASTTPNAQQYMTNTPPYTAASKFDFPGTDFTYVKSGDVYTMGRIYDNYNATSAAAQGQRGARILKGTFSAGVFNWTSDSIIPTFRQNSATNEEMFIRGLSPQMAWNNQGDVGYIAFIGARPGALKSNSGYQPVVYKTTNSGASWSLLPGINFNDTVAFAATHKHIPAARGGTFTIPFFWYGEGMDMIVDKDNKLHFVSTVVAASKSDPDSIGYIYQYNNKDQQTYMFGHVPGLRPYIYDFTETATGWKVMMVDSMSSEAPGSRTGDDGYTFNPWDADPSNSNSKIDLDARIQLSRTPDGRHIIYSWSESDTNFTDQGVKWNQYPNIKARVYDTHKNKMGAIEYNVTNPPTGANQNIQSSAYNKYMSPKCLVTYGADSLATFKVPMTVSNSLPLAQLLPNTHWYSTVELVNPFTVGIAEQVMTSVNNSVVYPNPASGSATLKIDLKDNSKVELSVMNIVGQVVKSNNTQAQIGENTIQIDLSGLTTGIYLVNVKVGNSVSTKKLIVE